MDNKISSKTDHSSNGYPAEKQSHHKKVSIIGCGQVGLAIAYSILNQELCDHLTLIDINGPKMDGEAKDFEQASSFSKCFCKVVGSTNYDASKDSDLIFITAGAKQRPGQSRLDLLNINVKIMKIIIPEVLIYSPNAPICMVSNPCDIITAIANKIAKDTHPGQIFGSGTVLDTGRFKQELAIKLNLNIRDISGYVIGEHGDSSVVVWSSIQNKGTNFLKPDQEPGDFEKGIHQKVVHAAGNVIEKKGYTNWAVGMACTDIAKAVLFDSKKIMPVSVSVHGYAGVDEDVFLSVPCVVGSDGAQKCSELSLTESERRQFNASALTIWNAQMDLWDSI